MAESIESPPPLKPIYFLGIREKEPENLWKNCVKEYETWHTKDCSQGAMVSVMNSFKKERALNMVWGEKKLKDELPKGVDEKKTFRVLGEIYDECFPDITEPEPRIPPTGTNAEKDRTSFRQLTQHMHSFKLLCKDDTLGQPLTEELIKEAHGVLMEGLKNESGEDLHTGVYRITSASAGDHSFPSPGCVATGMEKIVREYNEKVAGKHEMYSLASWLLYKFVTLHPFEDGNGRMCRLLWCYSLMKSGLPFPCTISSGHKKAHNHFVMQIQKDRSEFGQPNLTTLTVYAIHRAWRNFRANLEFELSKYSL